MTTDNADTHQVGLTCMFLDHRSKTEYPERTHECTERTCNLHKGKNRLRFKP